MKTEKQHMTFADWYEAKIGISLEDAKRAQVTDLSILEDAWNFGNELANEKHNTPI